LSLYHRLTTTYLKHDASEVEVGSRCSGASVCEVGRHEFGGGSRGRLR
jgi:hypothetical protein